MHRLLERQIRRHYGAVEIPETIRPLLASISETYAQHDADRTLLDHSMNTVSQELLERNRRLREALDEQTRHEKELDLALAMLRGTIDSTADGILVVDEAGRTVLTNARFVEMWCIPPEQIAAANDELMLVYVRSQLADPDAFMARVQALYADKQASSSDEVQFKDGRVFERSSRPLLVNGESAGRVWTFRDATDYRALQHQLLQSQKMEAVGQLAGGVAHDFNNLLTVIGMHCEFMTEGAAPDHPWRDDIGAVVFAADRAAALTRQLLAFSRKQLLKPVALALSAVATGLEPMLRRLLGEDIRITITSRDDAGVVLADPLQMEQVIMNLAVNARDAMPQGGELIIRTAQTEVDDVDPRVAAGMMVPGQYVVLTVSDTGSGMPSHVRDRIFEPFFTTKDPGKGTGLGLSTVYGIVKQSGGHVMVYSEPGEGTMFKVYLPLIAGASAANADLAPADPMPGTETILLVEDEEPLRNAARRSLERCGYHVISARHGLEAAELASDPSLDIDLLVTDVVMPGMGGRDLADRLRRDRPHLPLLFMSGYTDDDIFRRGMLPSDAAFLEKPFSTRSLTIAVRSVLSPPVPQ